MCHSNPHQTVLISYPRYFPHGLANTQCNPHQSCESLRGMCTCRNLWKTQCCAADLTTLYGGIVKCQMRIGTGERGGVRHVGELQHCEQDHPVFLSQHANGHIPVGILKLLHLSHRSSPTTANVSAAGVGRAGLSLCGWLSPPLHGADS
jgi:hypothetical protein